MSKCSSWSTSRSYVPAWCARSAGTGESCDMGPRAPRSRIMKLVATLLITLFLLGSAPTADASLADALKDIDQKVLFLYTLRSAPANPSRCTCTAVRKGGCITAAHCVGGDTTVAGRLGRAVMANSALDIATVAFYSRSEQPLEVSTEELAYGEQLWVVGYVFGELTTMPAWVARPR